MESITVESVGVTLLTTERVSSHPNLLELLIALRDASNVPVCYLNKKPKGKLMSIIGLLCELNPKTFRLSK